MKSEVRRVMSQVLGVPPNEIADDATAETLECWSSIAHLNLVMALEEEFAVRFTDSQIPALVSCESIADAVSRARGSS